MWCYGGVTSLVLAISIIGSVCQGLLVVGPNRIRSNHKYTVVITNFKEPTIELVLAIEGIENSIDSVLNLTKSVDVRPKDIRVVDFDIPGDLPSASYKLTIDGHRGFSYHEEEPLTLVEKTISGLIQFDKPVYKPGETANFRIIVLDTELKPPVNVKTVSVAIHDPNGNQIRKWSAARLNVGVFEAQLEIAPSPVLGLWDLSVVVEGEQLVSKSFEVKEYVLSTFNVDVLPTVIPLQEHQGLNLTVTANYFSGKPVQGTAILSLLADDDSESQTKRWNLNGMDQVHLSFTEEFEFMEDQQKQDVYINITFIETFTNRTVTKRKPITVYKYPYHVELKKENAQFRVGMPYKFDILVKYHDGTPATYIKTQVTIDGLEDEYNKALTSDKKGVIKQTVTPTGDFITVVVQIDDHEHLNEDIHALETNTDAFITLDLKSKVHLGKPIKLMVTCTDKMTFIVYYVVAKGNIIDTGYLEAKNVKRFNFQINAIDRMVPQSKIVVATLAGGTVVFDEENIEFTEQLNNLKLKMYEDEVKPGSNIKLDLHGRAGSKVALAAYDQSLLQHNVNHDVFWESIVEIFDGFHAINDTEHNKIHSMGLIAKTLNDLQIEGGVMSGHARTVPAEKTSTMISYRTNFLETWLWKTFTMSRLGKHTEEVVVPDTTTAWQLTAFSVDPVYGLGIIKQPIVFTTVQSFYIVDNLPYSIKRGEAVALQFTLFNNNHAGGNAFVKMYNIGNQTEFIGLPDGELSYTKSIIVPPKVGVPVSFLIKAKKLGEMVIRLSASFGREGDGIEKVIRVMPDSLVEKRMQSRIFNQNTYVNETFEIALDIDKKADEGSQKIVFTVNPNMLSTVVQNLGELLTVPTGSGESNMVHFVPNLIVLNYLNAIRSPDTSLINRATSLLRQGYQNQMRYRQWDGSFGVWQNKGGSVFLTAFVANALDIASKYIPEVDVSMVTKAFQWLATKQDSSGRFNEVGSIIHQDLQAGRNGIALTSYVVIAFLENRNAKVTHAYAISKGIQYIKSNLPDVSDNYVLSIATYALMLHDKTANALWLKTLIEKSTSVNDGAERYWSRDSHSIETTAYALLALIQAERYPDGVAVMRWLVNKRYVTGSFPRTQDTFVGLKALAKLSEAISPSKNDYTIKVKYNKDTEATTTVKITERLTKPHTIALPSDARKITAYVGGVGFGLLDFKYEYTLDLRQYNHRFSLSVDKITSDHTLKLKICTSFIPLVVDERSNLALVEVNFPSGYVVDNTPISEATTANPIQKFDIRFSGTSVVVYYDNMGIENNCFHITAFRRFKVALKRPAYVVVHDFFNPKLNAIQPYEVDEQNLCDVCEGEDCSPDCKG
ncbi:thioester-containing protein 1 [Anopheles sinensis]|uniref:TEP1-F n=1 Tax=Anopheles sinensis TaxID=74873 RepID=A0A084VE55_ANOSI|nr:thioester-containing protein 1 [Anopheles sinensis]